MTTMTTPTIENSKVDVAEGFDARTRQSADGLERLAASISRSMENMGEVAR
jgi:hypothetical protein